MEKGRNIWIQFIQLILKHFQSKELFFTQQVTE